jgi:hypothetical protein
LILIERINSIVGRGSECRGRWRFELRNCRGIAIKFNSPWQCAPIRRRICRLPKSQPSIMLGVTASSWTPTWASNRLPMFVHALTSVIFACHRVLVCHATCNYRLLVDGRSLSAIAYRLQTGDKRVVRFDRGCDGSVVRDCKTDRLQ